MNSILFWVQILVCWALVNGQPAVIKAEKYYKENVSVLEDEVSVGIFDIDLTEDLYIYRPFGSAECFSNQSCHVSGACGRACDYTDPTVCLGTKVLPPNCTCITNPLSPPFVCFGMSTLSSTVWTDPTQPITVTIPEAGLYTAVHPPAAPDNCSCQVVRWTLVEGSTSGLLGFEALSFTGVSGTYQLSRNGRLTLCPADPLWGKTLLLFMVNSPRYERSVVTFEFEWTPLPWIGSNPYPATCSVPASLNTTHRCVPPNRLVAFSPPPGGVALNLVIDPTERCGILSLWIDNSNILVSTTNPYVSSQNSTGALQSARLSSVGDFRMFSTVYPYCLQPNEQIYVWVPADGAATNVYADTRRDWLVLESTSKFAPGDYWRALLGSVTVECGAKSFTPFHPEWVATETMDTGSANIRVMYPSTDIDVFYPQPLFAGDSWTKIYNIPTTAFIQKKILVSVLLNQRLLPRNQPILWSLPWFPHAYQWLTVDEWQTCNLKFNGLIFNANGLPLNGTVTSFVSDQKVCDPVNYAAISQQIDGVQAETTNLVAQSNVPVSDVIRLWFLQDRLAATDDFYFCKTQINNLVVVEEAAPIQTQTTECTAPFGSPEFNADPCCQSPTNNPAQPYASCVSSLRSITPTSIVSYTSAIETCPTSECAKKALLDLNIQYNSLKDPQSCSVNLDRPVDQSVYWKCFRAIYGEEPLSYSGPLCTHDVDCPGTICSKKEGRCVINATQAEFDFISCFYDGLSQFSRTFISNELQLDPLAANIKDLWKASFSGTMKCSDPSHPIGYDTDLAVVAVCSGCNIPLFGSLYPAFMYSPGASFDTYGHDCFAPTASSCSFTSLKASAQSFCFLPACNIAPTGLFPYVIPSSFCTGNPAPFCGICENGYYCTNVSTVVPVTNCTGSTLCILANGTYLWVADAATCQAINSCDVRCNGLPCPDQASCQASGSCGDVTNYDTGIWVRQWAFESGACLFNIRLKPPFNPTSTKCPPPFRNTIFGCSYYVSSGATQQNCIIGNFSWGDSSTYILENPRWVTRATTQAACNNFGSVCLDRPVSSAIPSDRSFYSFNLTLGCQNLVNTYDWKPGRWLGGQPRSTLTKTASFGLRWTPVPRIGLDYPKILSNLTKAVDKLAGLQTQAAAFCKMRYKSYLDGLVCSCLSGLNESYCFSQSTNISSIGVICDEPGSITATDLTLSFGATSVPPATCQSLFISSSSIVDYRTRTLTSLRTLLVNYDEDTEYSIRNPQLGIWGKVLTDGFSATFNIPVQNITYCTTLSSNRQDYADQLARYPVLDLARRAADSLPDDLVPMGLTVYFGNGTTTQFCVDLEQFEPYTIYYFVQRDPGNYLEVKRTVFSSGEIAYLSVLLALYCFGLIAATFKLLYLFYVHQFHHIRIAVVLFLMASFFLFRVVLFSLLLGNSLLGSGSARAVTYLLFEFPILLYFCFVTNYICIWITSISFSKKYTVHQERNIKIANGFSILLNLLIFILFIIIIILFETIIFAPYFICGNTILLFDSDQSFALLLAYRIIFSSIAIILGITLFFVALKLGDLLGDPDFKISFIVRLRVYAISIVGGLGLIGQAIYFLIITATKSTPNNYASLSILLVLEIIPALLFVFVEAIKPAERGSSGSASRKSGTFRSKGSVASVGSSKSVN